MWGSAECDQFNPLNEDGEEEPETKRPYKIDVPFNVAQVSCGGLHTLFLTDQGKVYSQGCNDNEVLGRGDGDLVNCKVPGLVDLPFVDMICAGDVHSVAANSRGKLYFWGFYRNNNGPMGEQVKKPKLIASFSGTIQKILSGNNHTMVLNDDRVYSCGDGDTSVLGRLSKTRNKLKSNLNFQDIGQKHIVDVFCGGYSAFIKKKIPKTGEFVYFAWGLNNYGQLGIGNTQDQYSPVQIDKFDGINIVNIVGGEHHTIALDVEGNVYGFGRNDDGQIGLGQELNKQLQLLALEEKLNQEEKLKLKKPKKVKKTKKGQHPESKLTEIQVSKNVYGYEYITAPEKINNIGNIKQIYATGQYSFALSKTNEAFSWGLGQSYVLGTCQEESVYEPYKIKPAFFQSKLILALSLGGQHVACITSAGQTQLAVVDQSLNTEKAHSIKRPKISAISEEMQKKVDDIVQRGLEQVID